MNTMKVILFKDATTDKIYTLHEMKSQYEIENNCELPIDDDTVLGCKFRAQRQHCSNREFPVCLSFVACSTSATVKLWQIDAPHFVRDQGRGR